MQRHYRRIVSVACLKLKVNQHRGYQQPSFRKWRGCQVDLFRLAGLQSAESRNRMQEKSKPNTQSKRRVNDGGPRDIERETFCPVKKPHDVNPFLI
jgi:hypothetical protein